MSSIVHLKHPAKKSLDAAEVVALEFLVALTSAGIRIRGYHNEQENLYLYFMDLPEEGPLALEVHFESGRKNSGATLELLFRETDGNDDRSSLFRLVWWEDKGYLAELDTMGDHVPVLPAARAFAADFGLRSKGDSRPLADTEPQAVLQAVIRRCRI